MRYVHIHVNSVIFSGKLTIWQAIGTFFTAIAVHEHGGISHVHALTVKEIDDFIVLAVSHGVDSNRLFSLYDFIGSFF